jgi:pre-60S factor REI1
MLGKGHCKFDISKEDSEFADFYTVSAPASEDGEEEQTEGDKATKDAKEASRTAPITLVDGTTARLPSGKIFSHRSTAQAMQSRHQYRTARAQLQPQLLAGSTEEPENTSSVLPDGQQTTKEGESTSTALAKSAKREAALALQLKNLSVSDRAALAHLPTAEQRSLITVQKKEMAKAERAENRFYRRVEIMSNSVKRSLFRNDEAGHDGRRRWNV